MIQPLRKLHRRIFILLTILLPALFIVGIQARHRGLPVKTTTRNRPQLDRGAQIPQVSQTVTTGAVR